MHDCLPFSILSGKQYTGHSEQSGAIHGSYIIPKDPVLLL